MNYSILMSVYERENPEFLQKAIESMLNQTIKSNDFIIVCDGELTDELYKVINHFELDESNNIHKLQLEKNYGLGVALNKGLEHCKNELVARMDSDDIALPNRCERQLKLFAETPELAICGSYIEEFDDVIGDTNRIKEVPISNDDIKVYVKRRNPFNHMTVMFKKEIVKTCGNYLDLYLNEDYYLWARIIAKNYVCMNIPEVLVYMRVGNGMYERRGGMKYIQSDMRLQNELKKLGLTNTFDFFINVMIRGLVRLIPNKIRKLVYIFMLRGKSRSDAK